MHGSRPPLSLTGRGQQHESRGLSVDLALVCILSLVLTGLWLWRTDIMATDSTIFSYPWDHHKYIAMAAGNPFDFHIAPYCRRVGVPLLAKALPFGLQTGFLAVSFASVAGAGVLSWLLARQAGFSKALALVGLLCFFALQWGPKFFLFDFWLPDATIFALIMLAMFLLLRGNLAVFAVVACLGVAVKESMLFVLPLAYSLNARQLIDRQAARRALLAGLPALAMFVALRLEIPAWNDDPAYIASLPERLWLVRDGGTEAGFLASVKAELPDRIARFDLNEARAYIFGTFGLALTLLPLFALSRNKKWFIRCLPFLLLVAAQMLYGHDIERYLILAFPVWLILALNGLAKLSARYRIPEWTWALVPLILITFELALLDEFFLPLRYHALALAVALALIAGATLIHRHSIAVVQGVR